MSGVLVGVFTFESFPLTMKFKIELKSKAIHQIESHARTHKHTPVAVVCVGFFFVGFAIALCCVTDVLTLFASSKQWFDFRKNFVGLARWL